MRRAAALLALGLPVLGLSGCTALEPGDVVRQPDGGTGPGDAGARDAGRRDAEPPTDGNVDPMDAGRDAGRDAGPTDAGPPPTIWAVAAGEQHTCAIAGPDRSLFCFGRNTRRQLSPALPPSSTGPVRTWPLAVSAVCAGDEFTCFATGPSNTVRCFGANDDGQLGTSGAGVTMNMVGEYPDLLQLDCGGRHACALSNPSAGSSLECWGANDAHQISPSTTSPLGPTDVAARLPLPARQVSLGDAHSCAVVVGSDIESTYCWGDNGARQSSYDPGPVTMPQMVDDWALVTAGGRFTCGALGPSVGCWGGEGAPTEDDGVPGDFTLGGDVDLLVAGGEVACARASGTIRCWGDDTYGQLAGTDGSPLTLPLGRTIDTLVFGGQHGCAVTTDAELVCWGRNDTGQASPGDSETVIPPTRVTLAGI
jgi:hypothetical protein